MGPIVYVHRYPLTPPCDPLASNTQSSSFESVSTAHAPVPRLRERTTNDEPSGPLPAGLTVRVADMDEPPYVAVMTTLVLAITVDVSMMNVAVRAPPATVTVAGTLAIAESLLDSSTSAPPEGAALGSVTVPCGCPWL